MLKLGAINKSCLCPKYKKFMYVLSIKLLCTLLEIGGKNPVKYLDLPILNALLRKDKPYMHEDINFLIRYMN